MEFQYKNRGFKLKMNFEIKPLYGMGVMVCMSVRELDLAMCFFIFER